MPLFMDLPVHDVHHVAIVRDVAQLNGDRISFRLRFSVFYFISAWFSGFMV